MLGSLIGPISSLAGTWLQGRVDKAKAETDVKVARARAEAKVYETEATSSMLMQIWMLLINYSQDWYCQTSQCTLSRLRRRRIPRSPSRQTSWWRS